MRRSHRLAALGILGVGALLLTGAIGAQQACRRAETADQMWLDVKPRADHALIADATVQLDEPASVYIEYGNREVGWLRTSTTGVGTTHRLPLLRLRAATTYQATAFALNGAGCSFMAEPTEFLTGRLPNELLLNFTIEASGEPSFPISLMDLRPPRSEARWLVATDKQGQIIWYYTIPIRINTSDSTVTVIRLANGNWMYLARSFGFEEISPDARTVDRYPLKKGGLTVHHDFTQLPDGRIFFIAYEERRVDFSEQGGSPRTQVRGDTLNVLDLKTDLVEQVWSSFDYLDPSQRRDHWRQRTEDNGAEDWTHMNTVSLGQRGNVIISMRNLDQILSLSPDLASIEWKLGGPGSDFAFQDEGDRFWGQHSVRELPGNRITMFDNGNFRPDGEYSRGLDLQLDFATMTASRIWEYRHSPDMFSSRGCNVIRMPNGNTLLNFGFNDPSLPGVLVEARPDGGASWVQTMWERGARLSRYRAYPVMSLGGETEVERSTS